MKLSEVEIGTKLEIEVADYLPSNDKRVYVSQLEWLEEDDTAAIAAPIYEGNIVPLETGTLIEIYFLKRTKTLLDLNRFRAIIRGRGIENNLHVLFIEKLGEIVRIQRRDYYRLDMLLEVRYRVISYFDQVYTEIPYEEYTDMPYEKTLATDLSGGGIYLLLNEKIEIDSLMNCEISTGRFGKISFIGKLVRCERIRKVSKYKYSAGIEFVEISDNNREKVIRFIFNEQRKLIKKGMI